MTSPLLARAGAVAALPPDEDVASHYGDPFREQRRFVGGTGFVDLSNRGVITVTGPDRLSWLHDLTSQHLTTLKPGEGTEALVLSPHGQVEQHLVVVDDGATTWLHVEPGQAATLVAWLDRMRFLLRVEIADVTADWAVVLEPAGYLLVPRAALAEWGAGTEPVGLWAREALRIAARRPRIHLDTDNRTIPNETSWLHSAVHLDKGCYRGQETVARVHNLGRPPRRLVLLHLDGSVDRLPSVGADVLLGGRPAGRMGTSGRHYELGPIGLALLKSSVPEDATLTVEGIPVAVDPASPPPQRERPVRPTLQRF